VAKRQKDKLKDDRASPYIRHRARPPLPAGPAGQAALYGSFQHAIVKHSKNVKLAKDFLRWLHQKETTRSGSR